MRMAILGTGRMGLPMALRLQRAGNAVHAWDAYGRAAPLADRGVTVHDSAAQAVADAGAVVVIMGPKLVIRELHALAGGGLAAGALVLDCSTVGTQTAQELDAAVRGSGARYMEGPIVGRPTDARRGKLGVFLGGDPEDANEAVALALTFSDRLSTYYVGPIGSGNALKLVYNTSVGLVAAALGETLRLAADTGLDRDLVLDALALGPFSWSVARNRQALEDLDFSNVHNSLDRVVRELDLTQRSARRDLPLTRETQQLAEEAVAAGHGPEDITSLVAYVEQEGRPNSH